MGEGVAEIVEPWLFFCCGNSGGRLRKMFSCVRLRHMDFLKYSDCVENADETALNSPSGLISGFSGHRLIAH